MYIDPTRHCWIDVIIPTKSKLWDNDVSTSFDWLGTVWADTLKTLIAPNSHPGQAPDPTFRLPRTHRGPYQPGPTNGLVCFGSLGPGEVTVSGRKLVGISQRRTKQGCRFQCLVVPHWNPTPYRKYLTDKAQTGFEQAIENLEVGLDTDTPKIEPRVLEQEFLQHLPSPI